MKKSFIYGVSVSGENFTDRVEETRRLTMDFENGVNVILISPRRMGKTSLVKKVQSHVDNPKIRVVYMDIYDCRSEYDFYNKFATTILKETSGKMDLFLDNVKQFLTRLSPKISFSPDPNMDYSVSLGITPKNYAPEEILDLPERMASKMGIHIVVCIDEFQQVGEWTDSLTIQKRLRSVWQHQQNTSYCLFGSKKHLLTNLFQNRRMPFYHFGDTIYLKPISTDDWIPFICGKFAEKGKKISEEFVKQICTTVNNHSSYIQQLAWNVMVNTEQEVTDEIFQQAISELLAQSGPLFVQQIQGLTTYQMNLIRCLCQGIHKDFTSKGVLETYQLGSKSNISRLKKTLIEKEIIEEEGDIITLADPVFEIWFKKEYM
ncbi:MAG: ATP-binding protein [Bacteroidaceae bacterium]|nr:ATP-binding protein [Bacteroides sp.]MBQ4587656.1 ATP-binding protein [Bacteroidaceae bacterium]